MLRSRGVPARARCGFATYLEETHHLDHWICEYWDRDDQRWVTEDPDLQKHDVNPGEFITGGRAWQLSRRDTEAAKRFGFGPALCGTWAARRSLVRDLAALHGFESVSGDVWGYADMKDEELSPSDLARLDEAAALCADDTRFESRGRLLQAEPGLRVPPVIRHFDYLDERWRDVRWQQGR